MEFVAATKPELCPDPADSGHPYLGNATLPGLPEGKTSSTVENRNLFTHNEIGPEESKADLQTETPNQLIRQKELMKIPQKLWIAITLFVFTAIPSFAGVVINTPTSGSTVHSPFSLSAYTSLCSGQQVTATGYSIDGSTSTTIFKAPAITTSVWAAPGGHTLHVKAWGVSGANCVTDVAIIVSASDGSSSVPSYSSSVSSIQTLGGWSAIHDGGTPGSSNGWSAVTSSPSRTGAARKFAMNYSYFGGERYSIGFGDDEAASNFNLDAWVFIPSGSDGLENLELDLNQVLSGGQTVIYGMQCDGWTSTWDIAVNKGTTYKPSNTWAHTSAPCNARTWGKNEWHHIQLSYSRNDTGWITYKSAAVDGNSHPINMTVLGAYNLGWSHILLVNVQLDGATSGSGSASVIIDDLTVNRW